MADKTYDAKCYDLAEFFLNDHPDLKSPNAIHQLAIAIQDTIEVEIEILEEFGEQPYEFRGEIQ